MRRLVAGSPLIYRNSGRPDKELSQRAPEWAGDYHQLARSSLRIPGDGLIDLLIDCFLSCSR